MGSTICREARRRSWTWRHWMICVFVNLLRSQEQPLSSESGDIQAVVNGELYEFERIRDELEQQGHIFKTKSDSEIALHLYEDHDLSFLQYLRGEFTLNIWDAKKSRFIAARDRFGIKPLYYTVSNGTLLVASEIKAFVPMGWKPEWDVDSIVNDGAVFDMRTCFKGVYKLSPAHYLIATSTGSIEVRPYWDAEYPDKNVKETRSVEEMVQGVQDRLVEAVRHRLRADVPLGIYLSGGIDSSCIAGIVSKLLREKYPNARVRVFSISFKDSAKYDESAIAERTAEFCNADFQKISLTEDDLLNHFEDSIWYYEQPVFNLNGVGKFLLSEFVRDQGYKVVLTGEGSDEHFGGYAFFHGDYLREPDNSSPDGFGTLSDAKRVERSSLWGKSGELAMYMDNDNFNEKMIEVSSNPCRKMVNNVNFHVFMGKALTMTTNCLNEAVLRQCGEPNPSLALAEAINGVARYKANTKWHPLHTALYIENRTFLPNYLCNMLGDRSEMAHSIEARTPFLDHHLCEYVNGLPPSLKIKAEEDGSLNEKWILKEAVKPFITEELYKRTKHPYIAPSSEGNIDKLGWLDNDKVMKAKEKYLESGDPTLFKDMLILMSYVVLSQRFNVPAYGARKEIVAR